MRRLTGALILIPAMASAVLAADVKTPTVRTERPRIFLRAKAWDGPSVERISEWMRLPEYKTRAKKMGPGQYARYEGFNNRLAILWMMNGDEAAGKMALERFKKHRISGNTPSYWGIDCQRAAACYDWLHDHPGWDDESRQAKIKHLEWWADKNMAYLSSRNVVTPFYSRMPGALGALTSLGLALHGDSPKAEKYVKFAQDYLVNTYGTIRQMEDGATCGATYGYMHAFNDLATMVAAWRSATDWDAAAWIKEHQGNWLERQMLFQAWTTYPNGWFWKDGDVWSGAHTDRSKFRMQIDIVSQMYHSGPGRSFALQIAKRWPNWGGWPSDYHTAYLWQFFVFNDPTLKPAPLSTLGRAAVFSPNLHGIVCWRDSWDDDAAIVHFKCGETVNHHASYDQGKFTIFKRAPLAIKDGAYVGYKRKHHMYYKSPWSANCVVFTGPGADGMQPHIDFDGAASWTAWKAKRDARVTRPPTGVLRATEANDRYARALGDLTGSCKSGSSWTRELVFLGYKYLVVLDRVKAGKGLSHRWLLQTVNEPTVDGALVTADNAPGRLFCRTLLPAKAAIAKVGGEGHAFDYNGSNRPPRGWPDPKKFPPEMQLGRWRIEVTPADGAAECVYLHVLFPTDTKTDAMPACAVKQEGKHITVTVGDLAYTFGA